MKHQIEESSLRTTCEILGLTSEFRYYDSVWCKDLLLVQEDGTGPTAMNVRASTISVPMETRERSLSVIQLRERQLGIILSNQKTSSPDGETLLTPQEIAELLNVSIKMVYEQIGSRQLEAVSIGRLRRVRLSAVKAWLQRQSKR